MESEADIVLAGVFYFTNNWSKLYMRLNAADILL